MLITSSMKRFIRTSYAVIIISLLGIAGLICVFVVMQLKMQKMVIQNNNASAILATYRQHRPLFISQATQMSLFEKRLQDIEQSISGNGSLEESLAAISSTTTVQRERDTVTVTADGSLVDMQQIIRTIRTIYRESNEKSITLNNNNHGQWQLNMVLQVFQ